MFIFQRQRFSNPIKANTPIVILTIKPFNSSAQKFLTKSLHPKIRFRFRMLAREGRSSPQCVYWAFPTSTSVATSGVSNRRSSSRGRWSSKGCELKGFYPPQRFRTSYDYINCSCDRAFGMAVLMDVSGDEVSVQFNSIHFSYHKYANTVLLRGIHIANSHIVYVDYNFVNFAGIDINHSVGGPRT